MSVRVITSDVSVFYKGATVDSREFFLIWGDQVNATGRVAGARSEVEFRERVGWVKSDHLGTERVLELYAIDVGQGDATFIVTPAGKKILVDGGIDHQALQFLSWMYRLDLPGNTVDIDLLVVSHADSDHLLGLIPIIRHPQINVKRVLHSGIALYRGGVFNTPIGQRQAIGNTTWLITAHRSLDDLDQGSLDDDFLDWKKAIETEGVTDYGMVDRSTGRIDVGDPAVVIEVLGPRLETPAGAQAPAYRWFDSAAGTINGHSVVLSIQYGHARMLLTGDINGASSTYLLKDPMTAAALDAHVLKAPHHGSHDYHMPLLSAVNPQVTVVSSGEQPDHGHPRANFLAAVGRASRGPEPLLFSTALAAGFTAAKAHELEEAEEDFEATPLLDAAAAVAGRKLFLKRLSGMINIRTNGRQLFAARRVMTGYYWTKHLQDLAPRGSH